MVEVTVTSNLQNAYSGCAQSEGLWNSARQTLAQRLGPSNFKTWIEPLKATHLDGERLILSGPNPYFLNWVKNHFLEDIQAVLQSLGFPSAPELDFSAYGGAPLGEQAQALNPTPAASQAARSGEPAAEPASWRPQRPLQALPLAERFTFDNFVVGDSNLYAYSAAKALASGAPLGADALLITSDHGLGKSHLSLALGRDFLRDRPNCQVYYLTAEDFTNEMTCALRHGTMEEFKDKYRRRCDMLLLEEVQFLAGKEKIQSELCFTLDSLLERGCKVVFTSPQEPKDIPRLGKPLRSRLSTALVSPIAPPEYETRLKILLKKAKSLGLSINRSILEYVAERVTSDVRQLESSLVSLKAKSHFLGRPVDLDMVREVLGYLFDDSREGSLSPLEVRALICRYFHLDTTDIISKDRSAKLSEARALGIYLARQMTGRTLEEVGRAFGRSHSSALYAINKLELKLKREAHLQGKLDFLRQQLLKK